jgi:hypothetical protein
MHFPKSIKVDGASCLDIWRKENYSLKFWACGKNFGKKQENGVIIYRSAQYSKYDVKKREYVLVVKE